MCVGCVWAALCGLWVVSGLCVGVCVWCVWGLCVSVCMWTVCVCWLCVCVREGVCGFVCVACACKLYEKKNAPTIRIGLSEKRSTLVFLSKEENMRESERASERARERESERERE